MDPNAETQQAAAPAPDTDQTVPEVVEAPEADKLDAFSAGVEEARAAEVAEDAPAAPPSDAAPEPEGESDPADAPTPPTDGAPPAAEPPKDEPAPAQAKNVDEEMKDLGITNERTQKRFRELSERASEADSLRERANKVSDWEQTIESTGATPQQFGATLVYLSDINSNDPGRLNRAYETMQNELQVLGKRIGREAPGFDPLSDHADLAEKVKSGEMDRSTAVELVQHRQRGHLQQEHQAAQHQTMQARQAEQQAMQDLAAVGSQLRGTDPQFQQKLAFLAPTLELIQSTMPPERWSGAFQQAYQRLPAIPAAAPTPVAKPNNPARASAAPARPATPRNPADAFSYGVAEAQAAGR